jgi:ERF superfamily
VQAVRKGDRNTAQNYNFRGIDAVVNAVGPAFRKHGVFVLPVKSEAMYRDVRTSQDKPSRECTINVTYRVFGADGDSFDFEVPGESMDSGDKGTPKAMSVALRTGLLQGLCIPTDEPDPDSQSYERAREPQPAAIDPVTAARVELMQTAKFVGLGSDPQTIGAHFESAIGKKVPEATLEDLQKFMKIIRDDAVARQAEAS